MVVKAKDIIIVPAQDFWINKSLEYAIKSWPFTYNRMGKPNTYHRIQNIAKGLIPQFAFEGILKKKNIKHDKFGETDWHKIDKYDIGINGKRCDIKSNFLDLDSTYLKSRKFNPNNLNWFLDCQALVPTDQTWSETLKDDDYYIFAFVIGRIKNLSPNPTLNRWSPNTKPAGKKIMHSFWDYNWWKPKKWLIENGTNPLGKISIISSDKKDNGIEFELIGTSEPKVFMKEKIVLGGKTTTKNIFFQLFDIVLVNNKIPSGKITISSTLSKKKEVVQPFGGFEFDKRDKTLISNNWNDIWIYDSKVALLGFLSKKEFLRICEDSPRFDKSIKHYQDTLTDNKKCLVSQLRPITEILK